MQKKRSQIIQAISMLYIMQKFAKSQAFHRAVFEWPYCSESISESGLKALSSCAKREKYHSV